MAIGRFAPSPTADLHLGNLRTAAVAWLFARTSGSRFLMRIEDLDPGARSSVHERNQLTDLVALGLDWDNDPIRQSERFDRYHDALADLEQSGVTFPCWCTRREIREATQASHGDVPRYPGTCRDLGSRERRSRVESGRPAAMRLRGGGATRRFDDRIAGLHDGVVDDVVVRRNDGTPAYNLAVVVDDADQGVEEVVRGDDLIPSTPAQLFIRELLGLAPVSHAHVPLVFGPDRARLAKRDGAVTLADLASHGVSAGDVVVRIAASLGIAVSGAGVAVTFADVVPLFNAANVDWTEWHLTSAEIFAEPIEP